MSQVHARNDIVDSARQDMICQCHLLPRSYLKRSCRPYEASSTHSSAAQSLQKIGTQHKDTCWPGSAKTQRCIQNQLKSITDMDTLKAINHTNTVARHTALILLMLPLRCRHSCCGHSCCPLPWSICAQQGLQLIPVPLAFIIISRSAGRQV